MQALQERSEDAVGRAVTPKPGSQFCTAVHWKLPSELLNVIPTWHDVHTRSVVKVGSVMFSNPIRHVDTRRHEVELPMALYVRPSAQLSHTQLDVLEGIEDGSDPTPHGVVALHCVCPLSS